MTRFHCFVTRPCAVFLILSLAAHVSRAQSPAPAREVAGKFGRGWNAAEAAFFEPADKRLGRSPLTIEMWIKATPDDQEHVFISNGLQTSGDHWEIGARRETGNLFCQFAADRRTEFDTNVSVTDGQWHYVAASWDHETVSLFLDNRSVLEAAVQASGAPIQAAGLCLGTRVDEKRLTSLVIDEVRITDRKRDLVAAPELPLTKDTGTLRLWNFEETREDYLARWTPGGETNQRHLPYPHRIAEFEFEGEEDWADGRWQETNKGPFVSHSFLVDKHEMGAKLTAVFLPQNTTLVFDSRACAFTAALHDSKMVVSPARAGLLSKPRIEGAVAWHVSPRKPWMRLQETDRWVPLDQEQLNYQRLYLHNSDMVFEYQVAETMITDYATTRQINNLNTVLRCLECSSLAEPLLLTVAEGIEGINIHSGQRLTGQKNGIASTWSLGKKTASSVTLAARGNDIVLEFQPNPNSFNIELAIACATGDQISQDSIDTSFRALPPPDVLRQPGDRRWGPPLETVGTLAVDDGKSAYLLDELTIPFENPFRSLFFISGVDFFPNGDAAVCTAHGEVWKVTGIDAGLKKLSWQRFATGLYQPLGLKILNDEIIVICRDQLNRLIDSNGDGEADVYQSLCHDLVTQGGDHAYAMRLEADRAGNLYFLKSSEGPPHGCSLLRWNHQTESLEVVASGFRHPYGLGMGPNDEITVADNEGNYVPSSKIDLIEPGGFYGYLENIAEPPANVQPNRPLCFIPKFIDNSCGGQMWVPDDQRWGHYQAGQMLHLSWGRCTLHAVLRQLVGETWQAATVRFPELVFRSGSGTAKFNPLDGQLYVVGLDGWQTGAVQDGCFSRVRHTGRTAVMPESFEVFPNGIRVKYSVPLDPKKNLDSSQFAVEQWNYLWSSTYGSFHYQPSSPATVGHDRLKIRQVVLLDDRTLFLQIDKLLPVDQLQLTATLVTSLGQQVTHELLGTINALPQPFELPVIEREVTDLFAADNLVAWCIVPFDAKKRGPVARAAMLRELGFQRIAYDWRDEHIATWDAEVIALREQKIELTAFWAPVNTAQPLNEPHWKKILELIDRHDLKMQLWVMLNEALFIELTLEQRVSSIVEQLAPVAEQLATRGCQLGIYNHGGWSGEPANMVAIAQALRDRGHANTGLVYNLHHGHDMLPALPENLSRMRPYLLCLNINGMRLDGPKILPIGDGTNDAEILDQIVRSGYQGPIGILDHREELDAAESLQQNLTGLRKARKGSRQ